MKRAWRLGLGLILLALCARLGLSCVPLPPELLASPATSVLLLDRHGRLLREAWTDERGAARHVTLEQLPECALQATLAAEDARYYAHWGVDPLAALRALGSNLQAGEVVAGGSTLTQQLVANLAGRHGKLREALLALRLETQLSKRRIFELYLSCVPYGNSTRGLESAARFYFGRPAAALSLAQAAFLAGIPRGPDFYDPLLHRDRAIERQHWILGRMLSLGYIDAEAHTRALAEPVRPEPHDDEFRAPHFCDLVLQRLPAGQSRLRTSLDLSLQEEVTRIVRRQVAALSASGLNGASVVVLDNQSGEVLAYVGSPDFFNAAADGQVDLAAALRQPGSATKPFCYALALEKDMTPASIIPDAPVRYRTRGGDFAPHNYDQTFHGNVRLRTALACSYNVPAVRVLHEIGPDKLLSRLHELGFASLKQDADHYGLALALGAGEVTLLELTRAFRSLPRGGRYGSERLWADEPATERQVSTPRVAALLCDILSDSAARAPAFGPDSVLKLPFPCAVKTGTSRAYRDNWTVGSTMRYTVGVWAGNTRGAPMENVSGVAGAGPIFREVMLYLHRDARPEPFPEPEGMRRVAICCESGLAPGPGCRETLLEWLPSAALPPCSPAAPLLTITSPRDGDIFVLDPTVELRFQSLQLTATQPVHWTVDGVPVDSEWPLRAGPHVAVARAPGAMAICHFTVR